MPNPQLANGHTRIANEIIDALARTTLSPYEFRVLLVIIRRTYGWHRKADKISLSQFTRDTGIDRRHVQRTIKNLSSRRLISVTSTGDRSARTYEFQKYYSLWRVVSPETPSVSTDDTPSASTGARSARTYEFQKNYLEAGASTGATCGGASTGARSSASTGAHKRKKEKKQTLSPAGFLSPAWMTDEVWNRFLAHRKAIKAPVARESYSGFIQRFEKLKEQGYEPDYVVSTMEERGWRWFKPEWIKEENKPKRFKIVTEEELRRRGDLL